jgi:hypothetical protein
VILASRETAFPEGAPFLLQIPNSEQNVESAADVIQAFVAEWRGRRVPHESVAPIDASVVEPERIALICREAERPRRSANANQNRMLAPERSTEPAGSARRNT